MPAAQYYASTILNVHKQKTPLLGEAWLANNPAKVSDW